MREVDAPNCNKNMSDRSGEGKKKHGGAKEENESSEKDIMELLEKIKDASNGPEFVDRRVRAQTKKTYFRKYVPNFVSFFLCLSLFKAEEYPSGAHESHPHPCKYLSSYGSHVQIRELDKTVSNLKKARRKCQKSIVKDTEELKFIDQEMESINARLGPLTKAYEEKCERRDRLKKQLEEVSNTCTKIMGEMNTRVRKARLAHCKLGGAEATRALQSARSSPETCFNLSISDGSRLYLAKIAAMKERAKALEGHKGRR